MSNMREFWVDLIGKDGEIKRNHVISAFFLVLTGLFSVSALIMTFVAFFSILWDHNVIQLGGLAIVCMVISGLYRED